MEIQKQQTRQPKRKISALFILPIASISLGIMSVVMIFESMMDRNFWYMKYGSPHIVGFIAGLISIIAGLIGFMALGKDMGVNRKLANVGLIIGVLVIICIVISFCYGYILAAIDLS
jgi:peptidoglycan/LPS O-acetylase OafA/YrhL